MIINKIYFSILFCLLFNTTAFSSNSEQIVKRMDPPHWYNQMHSDTLQILFYGENINHASLKILNNKASLIRLNNNLSEDFLIAYFKINQTIQSPLLLEVSLDKKKHKIAYQFEDIRKNPLKIGSSDVMYLLMPDRFANGNPANDNPPGFLEQTNREKPKGRHGGDITGILNHFNYLTDLGITSLWINPLLENNQPEESYHGYAATDLYQIDRRFGGNEEYLLLSERCMQNGIKLVMDVVYNHIGNEHPFYKKMISPDWFHLFDSFTQSNYRGAAMADPYASEYDKTKMSQGWFDRHMPDLRQENHDLAIYLTQNTLWWIAYARLAGVRIDTYPYPDLGFMENLVAQVKRQFPDVFIFGETWEHGEPLQAFYARNIFKHGHQSSLDGVTDFQLYFAMQQAFSKPFDWTTGLSSLYYVMTKDYLYINPDYLVTFADNHDLDRFMGVLQNDTAKWKMAMGYLLTTRGIPCIYYGTELGMNDRGDHGLLRRDMPGGWPGDKTSVFDRTDEQSKTNVLFEYLKTLNKFRSSHQTIFEQGERIQFIPEKGVYVYGVRNGKEKLLVLMNQEKRKQVLNTSRFSEWVQSGEKGMEIISQEEVDFGKEFNLNPESIVILFFQER